MKLTRCPHCETLFEVSLNELKTAEGAVRCGQCLRIFNATYHLNGQQAAFWSHAVEPEITDSAPSRDPGEDLEGKTSSVTMSNPSLEDVTAASLSDDAWQAPAPHPQSIPTITERLNAQSLDDQLITDRPTAEDHHTSDIAPHISSAASTGALTEVEDTAIAMGTTTAWAEDISASSVATSPTTHSTTMKSSTARPSTTRSSTTQAAPTMATASKASTAASDETLDFEKLLGLKPEKAHTPNTSPAKQTDDLNTLFKIGQQTDTTATEPASSTTSFSTPLSAAETTAETKRARHDDEPVDDDYEALAESWRDWVRQQWQWIGAAIILMLAGAIGVLSITPNAPTSLSNYRIESTQVQTAPIQSRLIIQFELRNLTDQPMFLEGIDLKLKNLTDSVLSEHHISREQIKGDLESIAPFSTRTLKVEVPRPGTLVASVEIVPLESD